MLVISQNLTLSEAEAALPAGTPFILYDNRVTFSNVSADSEDADFPITNVANPATNLEWRSASTAEQFVTLAIAATEPVDAIGIARHNFGTEGIAVTVGYFDTSSPPVFVALTDAQIPPDDGPLLFQFTADNYDSLSIKLGAGDAEPRIGVIYAGKLLICERSFPVDGKVLVPSFNRQTDVVNGKSEAGDYLGRIVLNQFTQAAITFTKFKQAWFRSYFLPFIRAVQDDVPFFYAWQPASYPYEVAYCWLTDDPQPGVDPVTGRVDVQLNINGIVA